MSLHGPAEDSSRLFYYAYSRLRAALREGRQKKRFEEEWFTTSLQNEYNYVLSVLGHAIVSNQRPGIPPLLSVLSQTPDIDDWIKLSTYGATFPNVSASQDPTRVFEKYNHAWWTCQTEEEANKVREEEEYTDILEEHYEKYPCSPDILDSIRTPEFTMTSYNKLVGARHLVRQAKAPLIAKRSELEASLKALRLLRTVFERTGAEPEEKDFARYVRDGPPPAPEFPAPFSRILEDEDEDTIGQFYGASSPVPSLQATSISSANLSFTAGSDDGLSDL